MRARPFTPVFGAPHNHDPDRASVCVTKAKANLKSLAAQTREKPGHLFAQTLADLPDDAKLRLCKQDTVKKMIQRTRGVRHPSVPDSLDDLTIDGEWAQTIQDEPETFVIYENSPDTNARIIVFASARAIRLLASANTWFVDGTFAMAPKGFMPLYVIRVSLGNTAVSTVYTVLQRKSLSSYMELFQAVIDHFCHSMEL